MNGCCGECSDDSPSSPPPPGITPPPTLSCTLQDEDPDENINTPGCICSGSTFPVLSGPSVTDPAGSCAYTAMPTGASTEPSPTYAVTTHNCQVCTLITNEEANCTPQPASAQCAPTGLNTATPSTTVQLSNNAVHVGELSGASLYQQSWNAIHAICPDVPSGANGTECDSTQSPTISHVGTVVGEIMTFGDISFTIEDSQYSDNGQRDAMLGAGLQAFANGANGKNCGPVAWTEQSSQPCQNHKRSSLRLDARNPDVLPAGFECHGTTTVCNAPNLITVEDNQGNVSLGHMNIEVAWQLEGEASSFLEFACEIAIAGLEAILIDAAPEVAPEAWKELGQLIPCCKGQCDFGGTQDTPTRRDLAHSLGLEERTERNSGAFGNFLGIS